MARKDGAWDDGTISEYGPVPDNDSKWFTGRTWNPLENFERHVKEIRDVAMGMDHPGNDAAPEYAVSAAAIDETMNDRNCRPYIKVYNDFDMSHLPNAKPVVSDRHGRLWAFDADTQELRMIHDPEAARC